MVTRIKVGDKVVVLDTTNPKVGRDMTGLHTWDFDELGDVGVVTNVRRYDRGPLSVCVKPEKSNDPFEYIYRADHLDRWARPKRKYRQRA